MSKYLCSSSITNNSIETSTRTEAGEFLAREAGLDSVSDLYWQDRHSSDGSELHWEITGYRWSRDTELNSHGLNEGFLVGSVTEISDEPSPGWEDRALERAWREGVL